MRLHTRTESRLPPFDEIREQVAAAFADERRRSANEARYREMRDRYDVVVERPDVPPAAP